MPPTSQKEDEMTTKVSYVYKSNKNYVPKWVIAFTYHWWRFLLKPFGRDTKDTWNNQICKKFWALVGVFFAPYVVFSSLGSIFGNDILSEMAWAFLVTVPAVLLGTWGLRVFFENHGRGIANVLNKAIDAVIEFFKKKVVWIPLVLVFSVAMVWLLVYFVILCVQSYKWIFLVVGGIVTIGVILVSLVLGIRELARGIDSWWNDWDRQAERNRKRRIRNKVADEAKTEWERQVRIRKVQRNNRRSHLNPVTKFFLSLMRGILKGLTFILELAVAIFMGIIRIGVSLLKGVGVMIRSTYQRTCPIVTVKRVVLSQEEKAK